MKLAEALLRRKELSAKVDQVHKIKTSDVFELKMQRRQVNETIDDITANVPKLSLAEVTAEYDYYAKQLRRIDAAIQQANWTTEVDVDPEVNKDFQVVKE